MTEVLCTAPFAEEHPDGDQWASVTSRLFPSLSLWVQCWSASPQLPRTTEVLLLCTHPFLDIFLMQKSYAAALDTGIQVDQICVPHKQVFQLPFCLLSWQVNQLYFNVNTLGWETLGQNLSLQACFISWETFIKLHNSTNTDNLNTPDMRKVRDKMSTLFLKITDYLQVHANFLTVGFQTWRCYVSLHCLNRP